MSQLHIKAEPGDFAPTVLLPGDPNRARAISRRFDEGSAREVNDHRGMLGFTGTFDGQPVSVQATGMGTPSISIVVEELLRLGARRFIRIGTCGGFAADLRLGDLVIATAATPADGATRTYLAGDPYAPAPHFGLTHGLVHAAEAAGIEARVGPIVSVDVFYNPDPDYAKTWRERGVVAVEMEASALFYLAARSGAEAACILTVSDLVNEEITPEAAAYIPADQLAAAVDRMTEVALRGAIDRRVDSLP